MVAAFLIESAEVVDVAVRTVSFCTEATRLRFAASLLEVDLRLVGAFIATGDLIGSAGVGAVIDSPRLRLDPPRAAVALRTAGALSSVPASAEVVNSVSRALRRLLAVSMGARRRRFGLVMAWAEPEVCVLRERDLLPLLVVVVALMAVLVVSI